MNIFSGIKKMLDSNSTQKKHLEMIKKLPPEQQGKELGLMLYEMCAKCSVDFVNEEINRGDSPFRGTNKHRFLYEVMLLTLWIADKAAGGKKKTITEEINACYLSRNVSNSDIETETRALKERCDAYDDSWDDVSGHQDIFGRKVAEFIFDNDKNRLRPDVTFWLILYADSTMKSFEKTKQQWLNSGIKV